MSDTRAPARTHTYPVYRPPMHAACQHKKLWAYRYTTVRESDLPMIAQAFGITEDELIQTARRLAR